MCACWIRQKCPAPSLQWVVLFYPLGLSFLKMSGNWKWDTGVNHLSIDNKKMMSKRSPIANEKLWGGALTGTNRFSRGGHCPGCRAAKGVAAASWGGVQRTAFCNILFFNLATALKSPPKLQAMPLNGRWWCDGCCKPFAQRRRQHDKEGVCCFQMKKSYCSKVVKEGLFRTPNWILWDVN